MKKLVALSCVASFAVAPSFVGCSGPFSTGSTVANPMARPARPSGHVEIKAKGEDLLYATTDRGVWVFSYPSGTQLGSLTGFPGEPAGVCTDGSGNVFVTTEGSVGNPSQSYVYEYAHGGTEPIATFMDMGIARGCAADAATQDLAVANAPGSSQQVGNIAVYSNGSQSPTLYSDPNFPQFFYCTYDNAGNLFVDGIDQSQIIDELARGASALSEIRLDRAINPGSIQWVKNKLVIAMIVGDTHAENYIYQVSVNGSVGSVGSPILLSSASDKAATGGIQYWVQQKKIIGPAHAAGGNGALQFWKFPKGGLPIKVILPKKSHGSFNGATISRTVSP